MDFRPQIETPVSAPPTVADCFQTRPAPALSQSAGTYETPDISLDETIVTGAGAGDRGRSVSQSLAGSRRKPTSGRRPKLVPIDEQADAKGAGPSKAGNKAAAEEPLGLMDQVDNFFDYIEQAKIKKAQEKARMAELEEEVKELKTLKAELAVLRERERVQATLINWAVSLYIYFTTFWPRILAGVDKAVAGARQRWAEVAAVGYSLAQVCLSLVVLGVWELWEAYLLAIFPDEDEEATTQPQQHGEVIQSQSAPVQPQPQRQRLRPPAFNQRALTRPCDDAMVADYCAMHSEWAAHTPELIKGDGPIIFKVLGLARGAKDREDTLYPFTLRLEGVAHKIELNWSMTKETYNLLVETRADGWSFHFETTSPCPFKGQLWCGGNLIKAAHVAIFDRSNPEILRWRHVQVEKLLQAVVADREVAVGLDLDSLDRAIAAKKQARAAAAERGGVVAAY